ncbi:hypothetical protein Mapa_005376 [Marchantia paleacea]|nr:hypothetical protein Mapa_005376 [Marchantia paleacea]
MMLRARKQQDADRAITPSPCFCFANLDQKDGFTFLWITKSPSPIGGGLVDIAFDKLVQQTAATNPRQRNSAIDLTQQITSKISAHLTLR